ncbi:MAG: hypothetical protein M3516_04620 [Actinomycetota bacterium]|nr:hypothetical protein [Actinomycetota bacterium]
MPEDMRVAPHNVVAAYVERDAALAARERLLQEGVDEGSISIDARADALMVADAEMRQEADGLVGGPGLVATESQSKGAGAGFLIAGAIGAAIGLAIGAIVFDSTFGLIVCAIVGAVAGTIFGGTAGGFVRSRTKEKPRRSLQGYNVALGVHSDSAESVDRAEAILKATAPSRLERFNRGDTPHQVPLDPSG